MVVGFLMMVAAMVVVVFSFSSLNSGKALDELYPASGNFQFSVNDEERHYLWNHYVTMFEGKKLKHSSKFPGDVHITVSDSTGQPVTFVPDTSHSWSIGNHAKKSVGYVDVSGPIDLTIQISGGNGSRVVSFGKADMKGALWSRLGGFAVAIVVGLLGLIAGIWGIFSRLTTK